MSQTPTDTNGFEFYPTERAVVHTLLESPQISLPGGLWLEPCAGTGRIISAASACRSDVSWVVADVDERFDYYLKEACRPEDAEILPYEDFLTRTWDRPKVDVAIFNPPFTLTMEFVLRAMELAETVVCLQRQAWFGSKSRAEWLRRHCPDTYDLPWRPSFRPDGKTDNCEYSWYVWEKGDFNRRSGKRLMLDEPASRQMRLFGE